MGRTLFAAVLLTIISGALAAPPGERWYSLIRETAANPSREAALTEQESSWDIFAESPFAQGLRQTTEDTGEWLSMTICRDLGPYEPFMPEWSIKCGIRYSEWLQRNNEFNRVPTNPGDIHHGAFDYCNNRRIAEQEYNGGAWVVWELRTAKTNELALAETVCGTVLDNGRKRHARSCRENYEYPRRIDARQVKYYRELGGRLCG